MRWPHLGTFFLYLEHSPGASLVRVPTSEYMLSPFPWGPAELQWSLSHPVRVYFASLKDTPAKEFHFVVRIALGPLAWRKVSQLPGLTGREDEVPYSPCPSQGHL